MPPCLSKKQSANHLTSGFTLPLRPPLVSIRLGLKTLLVFWDSPGPPKLSAAGFPNLFFNVASKGFRKLFFGARNPAQRTSFLNSFLLRGLFAEKKSAAINSFCLFGGERYDPGTRAGFLVGTPPDAGLYQALCRTRRSTAGWLEWSRGVLDAPFGGRS